MIGYLPTAEGSPAPLSASVNEACRRWAQRPALTFDGGTITYGELGRRVTSLAAAYRRLGVRAGDRILCQLRNCPEHVVAIAAAWTCGAVHVGTDNDLTGPELARLVERTQARALVFQPPRDHPDGAAVLEPVVAAFPDTRIVVHGPHPAGHESLEALMTTGEAFEPELPGPLDPAILFLTSGTTGEPKAVVEPLAAHWAKMQLFADGFRPGPDDVLLATLPVSHVFGLRLAILTLLRGGRLVLIDRFSPRRVLEVAGSEGVTLLPAVPAHLRLLHDAYDPTSPRLPGLRCVISAAAGLPRPLVEWVLDELRVKMVFVFGCSEGFTTMATDPEDILAGSVGSIVFRGPEGTPADGTVGIMDPATGDLLADGEIGEIVFGAATPVRYWDHPPVAVDGWYHTGDLGRIDEEGRLYVVGRIKELVNRGGLHVSVSEVEMAIARHPAVVDAAVIAVPDRVLGEAVCACVVPAEEQRPPDLAELRQWLGATLARHKLPDELCVVGTIPRTDIGKVDRRELAARVASGDVPRERLRPG
ncbi:MAG TPA: class I adenylate-forming enzyme family protein [Candidatus Dormibacteraeota bacterium]|nr:class I adenylate-forming enzyme family protein [Candidatus Dormibacteraeota bacterium]